MLDFGFYNADCMDHMKEFPDNYFDIVCVDPPYGINLFMKDKLKYAPARDYKTYAGGDKAAPDPEYFAELKRISKNQIIFGANHFIDNLAAGAGNISSPCWIVWDKTTVKTTLQIANLHIHHSRRRSDYFVLHGPECGRET